MMRLDYFGSFSSMPFTYQFMLVIWASVRALPS